MSGKACPQLTHAIFDLDGTLINTTNYVISVMSDVVNALGKYLPDDYVLDNEKTWNKKRLVDEIIKVTDSQDKDTDENFGQIEKMLDDMIASRSDTFELMPGVERLVRHLHRHRIPMAIATGVTSKSYQTMVAHFCSFFQIGHYFEHVVCGGDDPQVARNKPHADVYVVCAQRFSRPPTRLSHVYLFEDVPQSLSAAIDAGLSTVLIPSAICPNLNSFDTKFDFVLESLEKFRPEMFGLPPYD